MEGEVELRTNGWCNDVTVRDEVVEKPGSLDEHAVDDCIKDWQLGLRSYEAPQESVTVRPSSRRTVRAAPTTKPDENTKPASFTDAAPRTETGSGSTSPSRLESSKYAGSSSLENIGLPVGAGENCLKDSKLVRRVSFKGELESSRDPNPPEAQNEAPSTAQDSKDCPQPGSAPAPAPKRVQPVQAGAVPLPLPELDLLRHSQPDRTVLPFRHSCAQVRPLDPIGEGSCKFDSSSRHFMSGPLASSQSQDFDDDSNLNSPSVLLRCNARRQHDEEEEDESDEDFKVGLFCGTRGLAYTNASRGDFVRLLSKLCLAAPLSKQSGSKVSQDSRSSGREVSRSSSLSSQWENNLENPSDDYIVFGRQNTLKLLCERCPDESIPSYNVHKPRKIRDHEPHQHFYKTISKSLDRKLRS